jgi:hypothetical protein
MFLDTVGGGYHPAPHHSAIQRCGIDEVRGVVTYMILGLFTLWKQLTVSIVEPAWHTSVPNANVKIKKTRWNWYLSYHYFEHTTV